MSDSINISVSDVFSQNPDLLEDWKILVKDYLGTNYPNGEWSIDSWGGVIVSNGDKREWDRDFDDIRTGLSTLYKEWLILILATRKVVIKVEE